MKKFQITAFLSLIGVAGWLGFGCNKSGTPPAPAATNSPAASTALVSVAKTSFSEVTSQLDPGGDLYLYLGTAQWLDGLSSNVSTLQQSVQAMPDLKDEDRTNVDKAFGIVTRLIKDSGIEDATGIGLSSIEVEKGMYHNKFVLHHYAGKGDGFLWKMMGQSPHPLTGLDFLPADTALAFFSDLDLPLLWSVATNETAQSGFPEAQAWLDQLPAQFEQQTQVKWDQFLGSLGGEFGLALTLNASNTISIPVPSGPINIPEPGLLIVIKVNDDTIFNRIDLELKKNPGVVSVDKPDLKMRTMPIPLPLPINLRPTAASSGGYLFIASSDALIQEVVAVKSGQTPGLKSTEEFKHLAQNMPDQGNQFTFMSARFGKVILAAQAQAISGAGNSGGPGAQVQWIQSLLSGKDAAYCYSVGTKTDTGGLTVGNGNQSAANLALLPAVAVPGMLAAIAVPNFVKARATSQQNACINNLRQIEGAKQQWALENHKATGDTPSKEDLAPYLPKWPTCPAGGAYTIGPVGEHPTCTIPNHQLE